jgi:hypothetical protein
VNLRALLSARIEAALAEVLGEPAPAVVQPAARPEFGDYQANGIMAAAKRAGENPRVLAERVVAAADLADLADRVEIAGPGFINLTAQPRLSRPARSARRPLHRCRRSAADRGGGLLEPQPRQGDARRPPAQHHHRRCGGPRARSARPPGDPAEPRRRLGHPVRHAADLSRRDRRQLGAARGPGELLPGGEGPIRQRPRVRRAQPPHGGRPAARRARGARPLAALHRHLAVSLPGRLRSPGRHPRARSTSWRRAPTTTTSTRRSSRARCSRPAGRVGRRPLRLPRRVHRQGRRAAAADRAESDGGYLYATTDLAAVRIAAQPLRPIGCCT